VTMAFVSRHGSGQQRLNDIRKNRPERVQADPLHFTNVVVDTRADAQLPAALWGKVQGHPPPVNGSMPNSRAVKDPGSVSHRGLAFMPAW
jgi:hypothetical protein